MRNALSEREHQYLERIATALEHIADAIARTEGDEDTRPKMNMPLIDPYLRLLEMSDEELGDLNSGVIDEVRRGDEL